MTLLLAGLWACGDKPEDSGTPEPEIVDEDGDGADAETDCNDNDAANFPGNTEECDGQDNNCDGTADEGFDADADGWTTCDGDCNDADATVRPGVSESCDEVDNNCDGQVDEGLASVYYTDADADGYGDETTAVETCAPGSDQVKVGGDCDDNDPDSHPGADDPCDAIDNDCDGEVDEDATFMTAYRDSDGDGFGDDSKTAEYCDAVPLGYTDAGGDCDDSEAAAHPGELESCDNVDNDCDGIIDGESAIGAQTYYTDSDGDGFGDAAPAGRDCDVPSGSVLNNLDCDDADSTVSPAEAEVCDDSVDNNCDGQVDENLIDYYPDDDGDGHGDADATPTASCTALSGYVLYGDDCDDTDAGINPRATETCDDETDEDCDGYTDEYCYSAWSGFETFEYSTGGAAGARNCEVYWDTESTSSTLSSCSFCDFSFEVDYTYDSSASSDDGTCAAQTWADGNAITDDHTFTYGYDADSTYGEAVFLSYYGYFYWWFYGALDLSTNTFTYTYGYEDYPYGSTYYTYYQYGSVELE